MGREWSLIRWWNIDNLIPRILKWGNKYLEYLWRLVYWKTLEWILDKIKNLARCSEKRMGRTEIGLRRKREAGIGRKIKAAIAIAKSQSLMSLILT